MPRSRQPEPQIALKLSRAQRKVLAEIAPELAKKRLQLDERNQRTLRFTLNELRAVKEKVREDLAMEMWHDLVVQQRKVAKIEIKLP